MEEEWNVGVIPGYVVWLLLGTPGSSPVHAAKANQKARIAMALRSFVHSWLREDASTRCRHFKNHHVAKENLRISAQSADPYCVARVSRRRAFA